MLRSTGTSTAGGGGEIGARLPPCSSPALDQAMTSSNTVTVTPKPCGGGCPEGAARFAAGEGWICCPDGQLPVEAPSAGWVCGAGGCAEGGIRYPTSKGSICCPEGQLPVESAAGPVCGGSTTNPCPEGSVFNPTTETCIPVIGLE